MDRFDARELESVQEVTLVLSAEGKRPRKFPVWFGIEGEKLLLLPMYGKKTKWFQALQSGSSLKVEAKGKAIEAVPKVVLDSESVRDIKRMFARKYGSEDVSRYYPTDDVALEIGL